MASEGLRDLLSRPVRQRPAGYRPIFSRLPHVYVHLGHQTLAQGQGDDWRRVVGAIIEEIEEPENRPHTHTLSTTLPSQ